MVDLDKKTLEIIDERYGLLEVVDKMLSYIQVTNKELVEMKRVLNEYTGDSLTPLSSGQLKAMREAGDALNGIRKIIENGRKMKANVR